MKTLLAILAVMVGLAAAIFSIGAYRWTAETRDLRSQLAAARRTGFSSRIYLSELDSLPPPVRRYMISVLSNGQSVVEVAQFSQTGTFNTSESEESWKSFSADQMVTTRSPGFDWNARVKMLPGITVNVHDAYIAGEGHFHAAILGLFSVGRFRGGGRLAEGELMRYLAEAAWYPTALLPSSGVRWEGIDAHSARAVLAVDSVTATLTFTFDDQNLITTIDADARGRTVGNQVIPTPWRGRFWNYAKRDGMKIPLDGEATWILPLGPHPYWRGTLSAIHYTFSRP